MYVCVCQAKVNAMAADRKPLWQQAF